MVKKYSDIVLNIVSLSPLSGGNKVMYGTVINLLCPYVPVKYLDLFLVMLQEGRKIEALKYIKSAMGGLSTWQTKRLYELTVEALGNN